MCILYSKQFDLWTYYFDIIIEFNKVNEMKKKVQNLNDYNDLHTHMDNEELLIFPSLPII